ncbi:hypothetical protein RF679_11775 [Undibacterium cyanobacteriorum]|uniref:Uncharacterized protein n=1 Tax=Undibacterium cyanobacteriorum TaxID=3073561 RepID=A0ABY9RDL1_9BURK|nr:hypothetical protein [Undibacterium sp. 20NA77.5]WMW79326.1 hypothetical protein RF679_11775 [Undibacterium sp. 20NA77.5]
MHEQLIDLGWPEATLFDMTLIGGELKFKMHDILEYSDPLKYEVVEVEFNEIEALRIEITPFKNDKYASREIKVDFGELGVDPSGFEGILLTDPFSDSVAEYYWVSGDLRAGRVLVKRTGQFVYKPRTR